MLEKLRRWLYQDGPAPRGRKRAGASGALSMPTASWTAEDYRFEAELKRRLGTRYVGFTGQGYANRFGGGFVFRPRGSVVKTYILHHTAGAQSDTGAALWRYHVQTRGWDTDGYHVVVRVDGTVELLIPPSMMSYGAAQHNPYTVHVSVPGNYVSQSPSPAMLASVYQVFLALDAAYGGRPWRGHREIMSTACPGGLLAHLAKMRGASYGAASPPRASYP